MKKRTTALLLACVLILGVAIGGTVAWLVDVTDEVENIFTIGDITIELWENEYVPATNTLNDEVKVNAGEINNYPFLPGDVMPKNPTVTVKGGSEACYLFVKVTADKNTFGDPAKNVLNYEVDTAVWTQLEVDGVPVPGVYFKELPQATNSDTNYSVLSSEQVSVDENITKSHAEGMKTNKPNLSFKAAAVQHKNIADEATAYAKIGW